MRSAIAAAGGWAVLVGATLVGAGLGLFFFGGLWWTTRRGLVAAQPGLWFLVSGLVRTAVVLLGFYGISRGGLLAILAGAVGFLAARTWVIRRSPRWGPAEGRADAPDPR